MVSTKKFEWIESLPQNIIDSKDFSQTAKNVLGYLLTFEHNDFTKENGYFFITNKEICRCAEVSEQKLITILSKLVNLKLIERKAGKRGQASEYKISFETLSNYTNLSKVSDKVSNKSKVSDKSEKVSKKVSDNDDILTLIEQKVSEKVSILVAEYERVIKDLENRLTLLESAKVSNKSAKVSDKVSDKSKVSIFVTDNEIVSEDSKNTLTLCENPKVSTDTDTCTDPCTESKNIKGPSMRVNTCSVESHDSVLTIENIEKNSTDVTAHVDTDENNPCKIDINSNSDSDKGTSTTISTDNAHNDNSNISAETIESLHRDPCKINSISDVPQGDTTTFSTDNAQNNDDMKNKFNLISDEITGKEDTQSKVEGLIKTPSPHAAARPADRIKSLTIDNALNELNTIKREWDGYTDEKRLEKSQRVTDIDTLFRGHLRSHYLTPLQAADVLRLTDELRKLSNSCDFSFVFADPVSVDTDDDNSFIPDVENEQTDEDENATEADKIKSFVPVTIPKLKALNYKTRITDEQADEFEKWGERFDEIAHHIPLKQQNEFADLYNTVAERFDMTPIAI